MKLREFSMKVLGHKPPFVNQVYRIRLFLSWNLNHDQSNHKVTMQSQWKKKVHGKNSLWSFQLQLYHVITFKTEFLFDPVVSIEISQYWYWIVFYLITSNVFSFFYIIIYLTADNCTPNPCFNGGICFNPGPGANVDFFCSCLPGFSGTTCQTSTSKIVIHWHQIIPSFIPLSLHNIGLTNFITFIY